MYLSITPTDDIPKKGQTIMDAILGEIKTGITGIVDAQRGMDAKFISLEEGVKESGTVVKHLDGRVQVLEEYLRERKALGVSFPGAEEDAKRGKFSFAKAMCIAGLHAAGQHDMVKSKEFGYELDVMQQATRKAMDTGTGGAGGGYVIPPEYIATLIELLRAKLTVVQAGATLMENLSGSPVSVPKQLTSSTVAWVGQNATITAADPTFGQVLLTPKTLAIRSQFSNLLNILSNPAIEQIIRRDFAKVAALEIDRAALRGSGASNQPLGLNGVSGLGTYAIGTNGGDLTRQDMMKIVGVVEDQNALDGKLAFITNPKAKRVLKNERIAQFSGQTLGAYTIYPLSDLQLAEMLGYPLFTTTQIPATLTKGSSTDCTEVYFGNFEELLIGMWGGIEILATNIGGNAWAQNAIEVRLVQNADVQVRHGQSFALCNDARTNNA